VDSDEILLIPKTMEKFLGFSGKMVKPSLNSVKNVVNRIKKGKLATLETLREKLASDFNVQTTCPASLNKALKILSKQENPICYWRVVKKKGELIAHFPGGFEGHSTLLECEGFEIDFSKKSPIVVGYLNKLDELA